MPRKSDGRPYKHEDYSRAAIRYLMIDVLDQHPASGNYGLTATDVADFLEGIRLPAATLIWRELVDGQLDADRADYLLRDSLHAGVAYGRYDLDRLVCTMTTARDPESESPRLAVEKGGMEAAEGSCCGPLHDVHSGLLPTHKASIRPPHRRVYQGLLSPGGERRCFRHLWTERESRHILSGMTGICMV